MSDSEIGGELAIMLLEYIGTFEDSFILRINTWQEAEDAIKDPIFLAK